MAVSRIAGKYPQRFPLRITCVLEEGTVGVVAAGAGFSAKGDTAASYTFSAALQVNDVVELSAETVNVFDSVEGVPVVKRVTPGTLGFGKLITAPDVIENKPDAETVAWADVLTGKFYRTAMVEVWMGITKFEEAVVKGDGGLAVAIGNGNTLSVNIADLYTSHDLRLITVVDLAGSGMIPMHHVPVGDGAETTILVGITGPLRAAAGA